MIVVGRIVKPSKYGPWGGGGGGGWGGGRSFRENVRAFVFPQVQINCP